MARRGAKRLGYLSSCPRTKSGKPRQFLKDICLAQFNDFLWQRLQTPDSFGRSSCQSVACSAVAAYYSCLNTVSCMCPSYATVLKNRLTVSQDCLSTRTSESFSTNQCSWCLAMPVPSWLSTLWRACTVQDPCVAVSHLCIALPVVVL